MSLMAEMAIDKLVAHVRQVCEAVLGHDASTRISVSAFTAENQNFPADFSATHEYMVFIDLSQVRELMPQAIQRLSSFLGKNIISYEDDATNWLYWGEGEPLVGTPAISSVTAHQNPLKQMPRPDPLETIQWLKTDTVLPNWLNRLLFDSLGARHEPNWKKFEHNLAVNADDIRIYLGTYFPRSYAEAFCILDALLANSAYRASWDNKTEAWLLDLGCGTGGNIIGLLTALTKHCPNLATIHVHAFDGNALALDVAKTTVHAFASHASCAVDVDLTVKTMTNLDDFPTPANDTYDFITSFKMGGEIISTSAGESNGFYHRFLSSYAALLSDNGLFILLDVTTKPEHTDFYPQLLNNQVSRFIQEQPAFATLVPVPCYLYESDCLEACFTQKEFSVTHRGARNDLSRVAYRVLTRKNCAATFNDNIETNAEYVISTRAANERLNICKHSSGRKRLLDGYRTST